VVPIGTATSLTTLAQPSLSGKLKSCRGRDRKSPQGAPARGRPTPYRDDCDAGRNG
jgi:hypothetical protein